jgi:hypothetical protein
MILYNSTDCEDHMGNVSLELLRLDKEITLILSDILMSGPKQPKLAHILSF